MNGVEVDVLQNWNWKLKDWYRVSECHLTLSHCDSRPVGQVL